MSDLAKKARAAMKSKAERLGSDRPLKKVDSSTWVPPEMLNADVKTGARPVSRRAYKKGGKVMGEACDARADRKARKSGGRAITANSLINRDVKEANEERDGIKHIGGFKRGGHVKRKGYDDGGTAAEQFKKMQKEAARTGRDPYAEKSAGAGTMSADVPLPPRRPVEFTESPQPKDFGWSDEDLNRAERGYKKGGRAKKADGGDAGQFGPGVAGAAKMMQAAGRANVPSSILSSVPASSRMSRATGMKKGGEAEKHSDEAADKALIRKMVKPEARTGKAEGGGKWIQDAIKHPGALRKALHVKEGEKIPAKKLEKATHSDNPKLAKRANLAKTLGRMNRDTGGGVFSGPGYPGKVPGATGGRTARASGGKTKGKTNVNIVIAAGKPADQDAMMGPPPGALPTDNRGAGIPVPVPPPAAAGAPGGAPGGMPMPIPVPMPMGAGAPTGAPTPRRDGGRLTKAARSYKDMTAGAGSGEGRLQKTDIAKRTAHKAGGKVYRSYKDMDAGAGSGLGRLEKTEIEGRKR